MSTSPESSECEKPEVTNTELRQSADAANQTNCETSAQGAELCVKDSEEFPGKNAKYRMFEVGNFNV